MSRAIAGSARRRLHRTRSFSRGGDGVAAAAAKGPSPSSSDGAVEGNALLATALVVGVDGTHLGYQDEAPVDPSEDGFYSPARRAASSPWGRSPSAS